MKTYVINLNRSPERWAWMCDQAREADIPLERIAAVDGAALSYDEISDLIDGSSESRILSTGEIACVLSHRIAWAAIAAGEEPYAAVFEDDLHFGEDIAAFLGSDAWIPEGADLVRLETFGARTAHLADPASQWNGRSTHLLVGAATGAGAYVISREFSRRALAATRKISDAVDEVIFGRKAHRFDDLAAFQLSPAICIQDKVRPDRATRLVSTIAEGRRASWHSAKPRGFQKLWHEARRVAAQTEGFLTLLPHRLGRRVRTDVEFQ